MGTAFATVRCIKSHQPLQANVHFIEVLDMRKLLVVTLLLVTSPSWAMTDAERRADMERAKREADYEGWRGPGREDAARNRREADRDRRIEQERLERRDARRYDRESDRRYADRGWREGRDGGWYYDDDRRRGRGQGDNRVRGVPPGHMPPSGQCRIWYQDRPPGHQPPPGDCRRLSRDVPDNARLIRGR